ncbi:MAG: hypothetical protein WCP97_01300 [bacterium]
MKKILLATGILTLTITTLACTPTASPISQTPTPTLQITPSTVAGTATPTQTDQQLLTPPPEFTPITEKQSTLIAEDYLKKLDIYAKNGGKDLQLLDSNVNRCLYCWTFTFSFSTTQGVKKYAVVVKEGSVSPAESQEVLGGTGEAQ